MSAKHALLAKRVSIFFLGVFLPLAVLVPRAATAQDDDPPSRVARLGYVEGAVSFQPGGTDDWVAAPLNRPVTTGDKLWSDRDGRAELQLDGSVLRLSSNTAISFLNLGDNITQVELTAGTLLVHVRRLADSETYEIDTPNLAFSILRPGLYRLSVDQSGNATAIRVRAGQGEVTGGGVAYALHANDYEVFSGADQLAESVPAYGAEKDPFDAWSASRDDRFDRAASVGYVSPDVVGYEDLEDEGDWRPVSDYGYVWFPRRVGAGWAPYHNGHWSYIAPWGYTWVDDQPWGFAPFHYGRWIWEGGSWGWVPCRPRAEGAVYVRPVYAPALVAWVGVGAGIAWFALGPREVFVPSYPVSRRYVTNVNVSNTTVNTTVINNIYNTTIVNNKTVNVTYVNRGVPGAVAATTSQVFTTAQPVAKNLVKIDQRTLTSAPAHPLAPAGVPTKQAVLGSGRTSTSLPPPAVRTRTVVARTVPPPVPSLETRQAAIRNNGGKPLSVSQIRSLQGGASPPGGAPPRSAAVRIAPLATPAVAKPPAAAKPPALQPPAAKPPALQPPAAKSPALQPPAAKSPALQPPAARPPPLQSPAVRPPTLQSPASPEPARRAAVSPEISRPAAAAIHPNEAPPPPKPASPSIASSALERQHLQEQQQLHAQQELERQRVQQQQEQEHARLAKLQADAARNQELEQQHHLQTQQLLQQHAQQQQQQERQQEQQRQASQRPANPKEEHPKK